MKSTMKDVAREAGVSLGTVSNVLNNHPSVSGENREKVLLAVKKLNYNPNYAARALKTQRSKSVGLILPDIGNPFYPECARGVEDTARANGYNLFLCNSDRDEKKERNYINALFEKLIDGLILFKTQLSVEELESYNAQLPLVLVDIGLDADHNCQIVKVDDYLGIQQALQYLWDFQHRRIAFIAGSNDSLSSRDRVRSYMDFFRKKNHPINESYIQHGHYDWHSGYVCTNNFLNRVDQPTAVLCANDLMAIGAMKAIQERGLNIPRDISVMGYDDIDMASLCAPELTTVRQPKYEMGQSSMRALLERIDNGRPPGVISLNTEIIERRSVYYCKEK